MGGRQNMAEVYYGVAGYPISHSLSPVLINIVAQHVSKQSKPIDRFKLVQNDLIEVEFIQDALAWGYVKSPPKLIDWDLTGAPFGKFRNRALLQKVLEGTEDITEPLPTLEKESRGASLKLLPLSHKIVLPSKSFSEEVWINLTSPLKHQLKSQAVVDFNDSSLTESVNVLRWDGFGWWTSNTDGSGVVRVAEYFGIDVTSGAILGLVGGGGAARSTAYAWVKCGGRVRILGGKRDLSELDWIEHLDDGEKSCDVMINFDDDVVPKDVMVNSLVIKSMYHSIEGSLEDRMDTLVGKEIDGRWLLAAQHLECWSQLWAPHAKDKLPSLDLLVTKLVHAETILASYA